MAPVWLNIAEMVGVNARKYGSKIALKDANTRWSYEQLDLRTTKLANALLKLGLKKGDKVAILLNNCNEFVEIYIAVAKIGVVAVPVNARYVGPEIEYIVNDSEAKAIFFGGQFADTIASVKANFQYVQAENYILVGNVKKDWCKNYNDFLAEGGSDLPSVSVKPEDTWILLYTSGTTGKPKGVVRSHESYVAFFMINAIDFGFSDKHTGMVVMPLYHVNSTFYGFVFLYIGGTLYVHRETKFDPVELLSIIEKEKINFISLVPTHYVLILNVPDEVKNKYDVSSIQKLLCSSAPVRAETKLKIMEFFKNVELYEAYGSTEAGLVTLLKPEDQLRKIGSIGKECFGIDKIKILDDNGNEVPVGEVGELYSRGPMMFDEYYKLPEKTKSVFRGEYFTAGDLVRKDEDGFYYIVDRKDNLIITGGEKVYPSEVEALLAKHPAVADVAVIGVPHEKWGEAVRAVVVLKEGKTATEKELIEFCSDKIAGYKKPKSVVFISNDDMPRTPTGKILHRMLRERMKT